MSGPRESASESESESKSESESGSGSEADSESRSEADAAGTVTPLGDIYGTAAATAPDRTALIDGETGESVTYADLAVRVARAGNALAGLGVERGDRVALAFQNRLDYLDAVLGTARLGAVPVPVNVQVADDTLAYVLDDCGADVVVASPGPEAAGAVAGVFDRVPASTLAVAAADPKQAVGGALDGESLVGFDARRAAASPDLEQAPVAPGDPAIQPYTSGSTGDPKGVVISQRGVDWNVGAFVEHLSLDETERGLVMTPLYHKNAVTGVVKPMLRVGGSAVVLREFDAAAVVRAVDAHDVTYVTGVPAVYKRLVDADDALDAHDQSSLTWASCGSASVPEDLVARFEAAFDADLLEVYGLTEGGPVVCHSPRPGQRRVGSAGTALPGCDTRVVDPESGERLAPGETGELIVASPGVARYHDRPDADESAFETRGGKRFLRTGDLVTKDADGYHYVQGRLDDMLVVGGENVYPAEVEDLLETHPAVRDVAVVGAPHGEKGEAPVAFVVADGAAEDDLIEFAVDRGPLYAHPRRVFLRESLPLTGTGKVDRERLEREARDRIDGLL